MSFTLSSDRQYPLVARATVTYADLAYEVPTPIIDLPADAFILSVGHKLVTAFADDASETQTLDLGTIGGGVNNDPNAFTATPIDIDGTPNTVSGFAAAAEVGLLKQYTAPVRITAELNASAGAAAMTAGVVEIVVEYVIRDRSNENQG